MNFLMHHPRGRALATHLNAISKRKKTVMDRTDQLRNIAKTYGMTAVAKHIVTKGSTAVSEHEFTAMLKAHCKTNAEFEQALQDRGIGKAYAIVREATHVTSLGYAKASLYDEELDDSDGGTIPRPNLMDIEPVMVGGEDAMDVNDPTKAIAQLNALAEAQHRSFEEVFLDPDNRKLANAAHRRPTASSTSGSELQR
jgi:hypothetical protein